MKKSISLIVLLFVLLSGCAVAPETPGTGASSTPVSAVTPTAQVSAVKIGALKGPTGMGMVKIAENEKYNVELFGAPADLIGLVASAKLDIAAVPVNAAATLYNKTKGGVRLLAINTLGVLYIMEKGETVKSINDLEGKTIFSSGMGSTPQYALEYVLEKSGVNCTVEYFSEHSELAAQALNGKADIILIPEPFVSTILSKNAGFRIALDFNELWNSASKGESTFSMGALIVRSDFAEKNKAVVDEFVEDYAQSVDFVNNNTAQAAVLIEKQGIIAAAAIAEKAIPNCNIVCITGEEMRKSTAPYLNVLFESNKQSVGGAVPADDFYYKK